MYYRGKELLMGTIELLEVMVPRHIDIYYLLTFDPLRK